MTTENGNGKLSPEARLAVALSNINNIKDDLGDIKASIRQVQDTLKQDYVTQKEFAPIKMILYGMVASILLAFLTAVIALVIRGG